jgi:hypothetical protein
MTSLTPFSTFFHPPSPVTEPISQFGLGITDAVTEHNIYQKDHHRDEPLNGRRKTFREAAPSSAPTTSNLSRSELNTRLRHLIERSIEVVALRGE